jgi:hypothetical protein
MPWAERIEEMPPHGSVITLVDRTDEIEAAIAAWNQASPCAPEPPTPDPADDDDAPTTDPPGPPAVEDAPGPGCGCAPARRTSGAVLWVLLLLVPRRARR